MYSLHFYGKLEELTQNSVLVDQDENLITVSKALEYGQELIREGKTPCIPLTADTFGETYKGSMYIGNDNQLEFSPNQLTLEQVKSSSQAKLDALKYFAELKVHFPQAIKRIKPMIEYMQANQNGNHIAYNLFVDKFLMLIYNNLINNQLHDVKNEVIQFLDTIKSQHEVEFDGKQIRLSEISDMLAQIVLLESQDDWQRFLEDKLKILQENEQLAILYTRASMKHLCSLFTFQDDRKTVEVNILNEFIKLQQVLNKRSQVYFDLGVFYGMQMYALGRMKTAESKLHEMLKIWEEPQYNQEPSERVMDAINEAIISGKPLTTFSYKLAVLMWRRAKLSLDISQGIATHVNSSFSDFSDTPSRRIALTHNDTVLSEEHWSPILGTLMLQQKWGMFPQLLNFALDEEELALFEKLFSYSVIEYEMEEYQKSATMLERKAGITVNKPIHDTLRLVFIAYCYQRLIRENEGEGIEVSEIGKKVYHYLEAVMEYLAILEEDQWIILEYLPLEPILPFTVGRFTGILSVVERMIKAIDIDIPHNELKTRLNKFLSSYRNSRLYMKYIYNIPKLEYVIEFHEKLQKFSDAYWSRQDTVAENIFQGLYRPTSLDWDKLALARVRYVEDNYPANIYDTGMVFDSAMYYYICGLFNWDIKPNLVRAIELFNETRSESKHPIDKVNAIMNIASVLRDLYEYPNALDKYEEALLFINQYERQEYFVTKANLYANIALTYQYQREYDKAGYMMTKAIGQANHAFEKYYSNISNITIPNWHPSRFKLDYALILRNTGKIDESRRELEELYSYTKKIGIEATLNKVFALNAKVVHRLFIGLGVEIWSNPTKANIDKLMMYYKEISEITNSFTERDFPEMQILAHYSVILLSLFTRTPIDNIKLNELCELLLKYEIEDEFQVPAIYTILLASLTQNNISRKHFINLIEKYLSNSVTAYSVNVTFKILQAIITTDNLIKNQTIKSAKQLTYLYDDKQREKILEFVEEKFNTSTKIEELINFWIGIVFAELNGLHYIVEKKQYSRIEEKE